jgi:hypothetical protein
MTKEELELKVEDLIDNTSLFRVLAAISRVCHYKAEHVEETWQDRGLARNWDNAGGVVDKAADRASVRNVSG